MLNRRQRTRIGTGQRFKVIGNGFDLIAVAHPHLCRIWKILEHRVPLGHRTSRSAKFLDRMVFHVAAQVLNNELTLAADQVPLLLNDGPPENTVAVADPAPQHERVNVPLPYTA